jgi:rhodanese-related sulfurtransferase
MIEEVTPAELKSMLENDDVQVVDIRNETAYRAGHVPGALNLPFPELPARVEDVDFAETVVVACPIGESSIQAARLLQSYEGVADDARVASLAGGYRDWDGAIETGSDG